MPLEAWLEYTGAPLNYAGAIPSSFGMDFIEIALDPTVQDQPLMVRFQGEGGVARFNVQVWKLGRGAVKPRALTPQPEVVTQNVDGAHVYAIPHVDTTVYSGLALIITRLDPGEVMDPVGGYSITFDAVKPVMGEMME